MESARETQSLLSPVLTVLVCWLYALLNTGVFRDAAKSRQEIALDEAMLNSFGEHEFYTK